MFRTSLFDVLRVVPCSIRLPIVSFATYSTCAWTRMMLVAPANRRDQHLELTLSTSSICQLVTTRSRTSFMPCPCSDRRVLLKAKVRQNEMVTVFHSLVVELSIERCPWELHQRRNSCGLLLCNTYAIYEVRLVR